MKKAYLVVYDCGMGGVWSIIHAQSKEEINAKYPSLMVWDRLRPNWLADECYNRISSARTFDIDEEPTGWLRAMLDQQ
ncbi:MAG TPA: hypothetical protein VKC66_07470 [Xanthobacteraceae bacterium]|nr:hypothetical protein [Xanthobacteraceae bacterium]